MKAVILFAIFALAYGQGMDRTVTEDLLAAQAVSWDTPLFEAFSRNLLMQTGFISRPWIRGIVFGAKSRATLWLPWTDWRNCFGRIHGGLSWNQDYKHRNERSDGRLRRTVVLQGRRQKPMGLASDSIRKQPFRLPWNNPQLPLHVQRHSERLARWIPRVQSHYPECRYQRSGTNSGKSK